jgi:phage terminase large subunit-like protein
MDARKPHLCGIRKLRRQKAFHAAGANVRERLLEAAMHATGRYPDWWQGKGFDRVTIGWACAVTGEMARDVVQRVLVGRPGVLGTGGAIPKTDITVTTCGVADLLDTVRVKHVSGGTSTIGFKSYVSARERFQGESLDWCWCDEECDFDIYTEILTRTNIGGGPVWTTFTPLKGASEVVRRFTIEKSPDPGGREYDSRRRGSLQRGRKAADC